MIPSRALDEWQRVVPWTSPHEIEQDLVLARLISEVAQHPVVGGSLALKGGTCPHKLWLPEPSYDLAENVTMAAALIDACAEATQPAQSWRRALSSEATASGILGTRSNIFRAGSPASAPSAAASGEK